MRVASILLALALLCSSGILLGSAILPPPTPGLTVTTFATGLNFPMGMARLRDGSMLVGETVPTSTGTSFTSFYNGAGQIVRMVEQSKWGVASGSGTVVASGLPGAVTSVRLAGDVLAVATTGNQAANYYVGDITFFRIGNAAGPYTKLGSIHVAFNNPGGAINLALDTRPLPGSTGLYDLYFGVAAQQFGGTPGPNVNLTGLVASSVPAGSLYRVSLNTNTFGVSNLVQVADGLRNTGGLTHDVATGDLYFGDNGYETGTTWTSADELNRLTQDSINAGITHLGYPGSYTDYGTGNFVGSTGTPALYPFWMNGTPGVQSVGISEVAMAPYFFPAGLNNGVFVGFHGSYTQVGTGNILNPVLYYDFGTGTSKVIFSPGQAGVGHLDSLFSTNDSLYVADFTSGAGFSPGTGVIYLVRGRLPVDVAGVPEPGAFAGALSGMLAIAALSLRRWITARS